MIYTIKDLETLLSYTDLPEGDLKKISLLRVENYDDIAKSKFFSLSRFSPNQGITLEFIDSWFPLDLISNITPSPGVLGTVRYKYTREYQKPIKPLVEERLPCERLIVDFGARIDCRGLNVQNLVLYNMLSAINLSEAHSIKTLVIVHSFNPVDNTIESDKTFPLPNIPSLRTLVIPESQEFSYEVGKTTIPDVIGIIPSSYYPSRFVSGIQRAREPFSRSVLPDSVYEVYTTSN